jgi:hypothetical protein
LKLAYPRTGEIVNRFVAFAGLHCIFKTPGLQMQTKAFLALAAVFCSGQANAETCSDLYGAIKRAAMYCDFFCDQRELAPLQRAYEASCIVMVVPLSSLPFENQSTEDEFIQTSKVESSTSVGGPGSLMPTRQIAR